MGGVRPDYAIRRADALMVEYNGRLIWQDPPIVLDAKYYRSGSDPERTHEPIKKLLGDMALMGAQQCVLFFPALAGKQMTRVVRRAEQRHHGGMTVPHELRLYRLDPLMPVEQLQNWLRSILSRCVAALADRPTTIACHGVWIDADSLVGDVVQMGDMALTVLGWGQPEGTQFAQPEAGKRFVGVELLVLNQGERAANLSSIAQMSLKDGEERRYTVDLLAATALGGAAPEGELAPGEMVRGPIGFQVPSDATGLTFVFDGGLFTSGKAFIALGDAPITVEPPAALIGTASASAAVGEPITVGDVTITVNGVSVPEGGQFTKPADGSRFLVVDLSVTNNGSQAANVSTMLQMKLKDSAGRLYNLDLMAMTAAGGAAPEGELAPGETVRGPVGFQVPADASGLLFVFDGNVFGAGKTFVALP